MKGNATLEEIDFPTMQKGDLPIKEETFQPARSAAFL
jgi:hypothetical protein